MNISYVELQAELGSKFVINPWFSDKVKEIIESKPNAKDISVNDFVEFISPNEIYIFDKRDKNEGIDFLTRNKFVMCPLATNYEIVEAKVDVCDTNRIDLTLNDVMNHNIVTYTIAVTNLINDDFLF